VSDVQFIGGEPTLHPDLPELVRHALGYPRGPAAWHPDPRRPGRDRGGPGYRWRDRGAARARRRERARRPAARGRPRRP
jgi:hypothetical protein